MNYDTASIFAPVVFALSYILGPFLTVVGSCFAYAISLDGKCPLWLKGFGWVPGPIIAIFVAGLLMPLLFPNLVDSVFSFVGIVFLFGYGWVAVWLAIAHLSANAKSGQSHRHSMNGRKQPPAIEHSPRSRAPRSTSSRISKEKLRKLDW